MRRLFLLGALSVVAFGGLHLAGLREDAAFLSGSPVRHLLGGIAYVLAYFNAVVVAPILLIAGVLVLSMRRLPSFRPRRDRENIHSSDNESNPT